MARLYPELAEQLGLTGDDEDLEINALLMLNEQCPSDINVQPFIRNSLHLRGKAACGYRKLADFVSDATREPINPAGSKKAVTSQYENFYGGTSNMERNLSILLILGLLGVFYYDRTLMKRPVFWVGLLFALGAMKVVAMMSKSDEPSQLSVYKAALIKPRDDDSVLKKITVHQKTLLSITSVNTRTRCRQKPSTR